MLHKPVEIRHHGPERIRLMDVRLGTYATGTAVSDGEQGFPVYIAGQFIPADAPTLAAMPAHECWFAVIPTDSA